MASVVKVHVESISVLSQQELTTAFSFSLVVCSDLIEPENGIVIYTNGFVNNRPAGTVATYTCETGYTLSDSESHICGSNGIWSGLPPTCDGKLYTIVL